MDEPIIAPSLDYSQICRTCLAESSDSHSEPMLPVFPEPQTPDEPAQPGLAAMLRSCSGTTIARNDGLPSSICHPCSRQLRFAFAFRRKCIQSHDTLLHFCGGQPLAANPVPKSQPPPSSFDENVSIIMDGDGAAAVAEAGKPAIAKVAYNSDADDITVEVEIKAEPDGVEEPEFGASCDVGFVAAKRGRGRPRKALVEAPQSVPEAAKPPPPSSPPPPADAATDAAAPDAAAHACPDCHKPFRRRIHMLRHRLIHSEHKPFACEQCPKRFRRADHLAMHRHQHRAAPAFACAVCEQSYSRPQHLQRHWLKAHGGGGGGGDDGDAPEKIACAASARKPSTANPLAPNYCDQCDRNFSSAKYLATHQRNQHSAERCVCKLCGIQCADRQQLTDHSRAAECCDAGDAKPFLCSECGARFVRNDYLVIHMRRHKGEKPYKCRFCGKGFPRATDLTVHERYHTGEKTHLCTECGKGFHRAYNLVVHMRTHTGERPYRCPHCERSFAQGNDLKAHVRRHTGERYKCEVCGAGFIQGYHLTQHKKKAHGLDVQSHIRRVEKFGGGGGGEKVVKRGRGRVVQLSVDVGDGGSGAAEGEESGGEEEEEEAVEMYEISEMDEEVEEDGLMVGEVITQVAVSLADDGGDI